MKTLYAIIAFELDGNTCRWIRGDWPLTATSLKETTSIVKRIKTEHPNAFVDFEKVSAHDLNPKADDGIREDF